MRDYCGACRFDSFNELGHRGLATCSCSENTLQLQSFVLAHGDLSATESAAIAKPGIRYLGEVIFPFEIAHHSLTTPEIPAVWNH